MVSEIKDLLGQLIEDAGVPAGNVARTARDYGRLKDKRGQLLANIATNFIRHEQPARKEVKVEVEGANIYRQIRTRRITPVVVTLVGGSERETDELADRFIAALPYQWVYNETVGTVVIKRENHSDWNNRLIDRYEVEVEIEFEMEVGADGQVGARIDDFVTGDGFYE